MENNPFVKKVPSFLDVQDSAPSEFVSEADGVLMEKERNRASGAVQNGETEPAQPGKRGMDFLESGKEPNPVDSFLKKDESKPAQPKKEDPPSEGSPSFMDSFLIEFVHSIKNSLAAVYHATVQTMEKYDDAEIRKYSHNQVREEIKKIDSVLNSVLNFVNINTPITKTNTLCTILEEILGASEKQFRQKKLRITQRYEKDIPETFLHPEQVRFIIHSVVQYAILSTPPEGVIGFLIKSSDSEDRSGGEKPSAETSRRYVEVMIGFNGDGRPVSKSENLSETPEEPSNGPADLILRLAKEVLEKNHGRMVETHGERLKTLINLRFPVERRKVVYYEPIAL